MELAVRAWAIHRSCVEHLISGLEETYVAADRLNNSGGIVAQQHIFGSRRGLFPSPPFHVDGIDGHPLYRDQQIAWSWGGPWQHDIREDLDAAFGFVSDGLHRCPLLKWVGDRLMLDCD